MAGRREKRHLKAKALNNSFAEPDFELLQDIEDENYKTNLICALNYINNKFDNSKLAKLSKKILKDQYNIKIPSNTPDWEFLSCGKVFWLLSKDAKLPEEMVNDALTKINNIKVRYSNDNDLKKKMKVISKTPTEIHTFHLISDIDDFLDNITLKSDKLIKYKSEMVDTLHNTMLKYKGLTLKFDDVKDYYQKQHDQLLDEEYEEYFEHLKSTEKKNLVKILNLILSELDNLYETKKKTRKPRKVKKSKKSADPTKMVKKLKYMKSCDELGLKSFHPEKIIGAKTLWLYNAKTRELSQYVSDLGFAVKGTTLCNYNEKLSQRKKLRKPKELLDQITTGGKVAQKKFMKSLTTTAKTCNGKINNNMILLIVNK